jgi:transcriptional regulator with XRE-family HTH domain
MARIDQQIRRARRESGFSQEALAERIGVPPADVHRYERGGTISARQLELIAVATGKPVSFFLDGSRGGSQNGPGLAGRLRAVLAWLSEPATADMDVDALLAQVSAREKALVERERRLVERERALLALEQEHAAKTAAEARAEGPPGEPD